MSEQLVGSFIEALGGLESGRDVEALAALFAEDAETGNVVAGESFRGREGAREFWTKYRDTFGEVRSRFRNRLVGERAAALEWTTEGTTAGGAAVNYDGVSILEYTGGQITRFRAYFNAEELGRQIVDGKQRAAGAQQ